MISSDEIATIATVAVSPLAEVDPRSLDELMSRDPLKLQHADRVKIVEEFRRMRAVWALAEAQGTPKKGVKTVQAKIEVDAGDLGI